MIRKNEDKGVKVTDKEDVGLLDLVNPNEEEREFPFSYDDFKTLSSLVYQRSGIILKDHKKNMVYSRLARRLRKLRIGSFADYLHYLGGAKGDEEISFLINAITTNLTKFFRESHHFEHLEHVVLPKAFEDIKGARQKKLRIWSAGCSSGEEPYSIAMVLDKVLKKFALQDVDAKILATDLDTNMLSFGRNGNYPKFSVENVANEYRSHFSGLENKGESAHISDHLRRYISFKQLNLIDDWPMKGPFDVIFCRNVMIYFDNPTKNTITQKFVDLLKPEGWLYVGHSETILDTEGRLKLHGRTIYQRAR